MPFTNRLIVGLTLLVLLPGSTVGDEAGPGYLGAILSPLPGGEVEIVNLAPNGPAAQAGLQPTDVITAINQRPIRSINEVEGWIRGSSPGDRAVVAFRRAGAALEREVTLTERPAPEAQFAPQFGAQAPPVRAPQAPPGVVDQRLGVHLLPLDDRARRRLNIPAGRGALVVGVVDGSPADEAGIPRDAAIVGIGHTAVETPADVLRLTRQAGPDAEVLLVYYRGRQWVRKWVALQPPVTGDSQPNDAPRLEILERQLDELKRRVEALERQVAPRGGGANGF